jgi:hypothetical protein
MARDRITRVEVNAFAACIKLPARKLAVGNITSGSGARNRCKRQPPFAPTLGQWLVTDGHRSPMPCSANGSNGRVAGVGLPAGIGLEQSHRCPVCLALYIFVLSKITCLVRALRGESHGSDGLIWQLRRRCALPCTTITARSTPSNCRFLDDPVHAAPRTISMTPSASRGGRLPRQAT